MPRRRQRHFNPATAGCAAVFDGRFGIHNEYAPFPVGTVYWNGRTGTQYGGGGYAGASVLDPYYRRGAINGQGALGNYGGTMYVGANPYGSGPTSGINIDTSNCSMFVCAKNIGSAGVGYYGRIIGVTPDTSAFYGVYQPSSTVYLASFFGNGSGTWNDLNENSPNVSGSQPFAACFSNSGTTCTPTVNTTIQSTKTVTAVSSNVSYLTGMPSNSQYAFTQLFRGDIGMIAIATSKLSTPVERRILQMMGRVWRIHTL